MSHITQNVKSGNHRKNIKTIREKCKLSDKGKNIKFTSQHPLKPRKAWKDIFQIQIVNIC
jgi:hypothetical protein